MNKIMLLCFPYAGGSSAAYLSWKKYLDSNIELCPVELSGRGKRINDPLYECVEDVINDIFPKFENIIANSSYALYGHSMGCLLAYEFARKIRACGMKEPLHAFLSGRFPPFIESKTKKYLLTDSEFIKDIAAFGGMNQEILNNRELMSFFLPIIRADYRIVELYRHVDDGFRFTCDLTILNGKYDDLIIENEVIRWRECTNKNCSFYEFYGGHFFINEYKERVIGIINEELEKVSMS